jgi:hypothetical protein
MIIFTQNISENNNLMAYNNNVVRFFSDSSQTVLNCTITIGSLVALIYPLPNGRFYFNFKDYITAQINTNNFFDDTNPVLNTSDINTFVYEGKSFLNLNVQFTINFVNETNESTTKSLKWLVGVEQLETYKKNETQQGENIVLLPLVPKTANSYYAKYSDGFPFDVSFLSENDIELTNTNNLTSITFPRVAQHTRVFFCDGDATETIADLITIASGMNVLSFEDKFIRLESDQHCEGVYFKWLNNYGGYSYWLFPKFDQRTKSIRNVGEINTNFENVSDTFSQTSQLGNTATNRLLVSSDKLNEEQFNLLVTILTSPKVFLFTGERFSRASFNDWMEVRIATSNQLTRQYKGQSNEIILDVELPDDFTITL